MRTQQKLTVAIVLAAPIILGVVLTLAGRGDASLLSRGARHLGIVRIDDVIYSSEEPVRQLREHLENKSVAGVLLRIDSPGGAVAPSQEIYAEVSRFRERRKPLVVSMANVAASGGYYIASPAQKIFANPGTITGSIGVIFTFAQYYKLFEKIGIRMQTLKAGELKDAGNPNREMTVRERAMLQRLLDTTHRQFIRDVAVARSLDEDTLSRIADGRILTGAQALEVGLVDTLGGLEEALSYLKQSVGLPEKAKVIDKTRGASLVRDLLTGQVLRRLPFAEIGRRPMGCYFLLEGF